VVLSIHVSSLYSCKKSRIKEIKVNNGFMMTHKIIKSISSFQFPGLRLSAIGLGSRSVQFSPSHLVGLAKVKTTLFKLVLVNS